MSINLIAILVLFASSAFSQVQDSVEVDSVQIAVPNSINNISAMADFYAKLNQAHSLAGQKINIVHIGDSHIQADLMTNVARQELQKIFGNGGRGFVFPYALAKTNGASDIRFSSTTNWQSLRNISPENGMQVGLSGIALQTSSSDFAIELSVKDPAYHFNTIKIISPRDSKRLAVAIDRTFTISETSVPKNVVHKIKSGEALSIIATKYGVTVAEIKRVNNLKSNAIRAGKVLKIPSSATEKRKTERFKYIPLEMLNTEAFNFYHFDAPQSSIAIVPTMDSTCNLSGMVLENDNNGLIYHNIGVNGAKFSDYNKYPLFFDQLSVLQPDLLILSLGTNESFDKMQSSDYMNQLLSFVNNVRAQNPNVDILVSTPPPSLFGRKTANHFISDYTRDIIELAQSNHFAVWDLYSILGANDGIPANARKNIIGPDRVHYTKAGYELQGKLLTEAILNGFYLK